MGILSPIVSSKLKHNRFGIALALCAIVAPLEAGASGERAETPRSALRYDADYPAIGYSRAPAENEIARLQARLERGAAKLEFQGPRGYLDSLLAALRIDVSSQVLVYSKTSLQIDGIRAATPRAIYFNEDTYVAWVQGAPMIEIATMDSELGAVFYSLQNRPGSVARVDRETHRCLACHDTFSMTGGGVPRFLLVSAMVGPEGTLREAGFSRETNDRTPLKDRWGGWYVTGELGAQAHLGNTRRGNLDTLTGLFDTRPYLTDKSDVVALLVLEHQLHVKNLITRVNYKARTFVARDANGSDAAWDRASPRTQAIVRKMAEQLVRGMLFVNAAPLNGTISGSSGFDRWFQAQGPRDSHDRSLRDFDLNSRLFKYPLSYVVYSEGFDALPAYVKDIVYARFAEILSGRDSSATYSHLSATDRAAVLEILKATKPEFARRAKVPS